jgi:hypothetical protein
MQNGIVLSDVNRNSKLQDLSWQNRLAENTDA